MLVLHIDFACKLCEQNKDYYVMPAENKVGKDDIQPSLTAYILRCKKCRKKYLLHYDIKML